MPLSSSTQVIPAGHLQGPPFTAPPVLLKVVFAGHLQILKSPVPALTPENVISLPAGQF